MATVQRRGDTYRITASAGYDTEGRQIRKSMTWRPAPGMTERQIAKELERQKVLFDEQVKGGYYSGNIKFQDFTEQWFRDYAKDNLRTRTITEYRKLTKRLYTALGHIRLDKLKPRHLVEFYRQLAEPGQNKRTGGGLAPKSILHYHTMISSVLDRAVKWGMIPESPCKKVDPPKVPKHQIECLDDMQAAAFLAGMEAAPLEDKALFTLALYTGMRRGELLGLEWPDVDFDTGVISIRRTSQYGGKELGTYTDGTKTEQSRRSIRVTQHVIDLLKSYKADQAARRLLLGDAWAAEWTEHPRLFTNQDGRPMSPSTPLNRLRRYLDKLGLPPVSLHSLRHTNATLLIQQGVSVRAVSGRLGHSQTSTTMNIYAHQLQSADAAAAEALDLALNGGGESKKQA